MQQPIRFFSAVEHGRVDEIRVWLRSGVAVDALHPDTGFTALMLAAETGRPAVVSLLLQAGAAVDAAHHSHGFTALMLAADKGNSAAVQALLRGGALIDKAHPASHLTALFVACKNGHADTVRVLLKAGAATESVLGGLGLTPLTMAATLGHAEVVQVLLQAGAAIDAHEPGNGFTALLTAIDHGHVGVVQALLQEGAAIEKIHRDDGSTPLMRAAMVGNVEIVQMLLDHGAAVNAMFGAGYANAGLCALMLAVEGRHGAAVHALLQAGADVDATYPKMGSTILLMAADRGFWDIAKLLLEYGADPHLANHEEISAFMLVLQQARSLHDRDAADEVLKLMMEMVTARRVASPQDQALSAPGDAAEAPLPQEGGAGDEAVEASILDGSVAWPIGAGMHDAQEQAYVEAWEDAELSPLVGQSIQEQMHLLHAY